MFKFYMKLGLIIFSLATAAISIQAQVTIGSSIPPISGALLDLKESRELTPNSNVNSTRGLLLPRVSLTSRTSLVDISGDNLDAKALTGLIVYNVNNNFPFCKNVYMWTSVEWKTIGPECPGTLIGLEDIDFGISANVERIINFKTNSSWMYTADSNLPKVLSSYQFAPNETHAGGEEEALSDVSFKIESGDHTPAAGVELETKLTFTATKEKSISQTISVKRKVPTYNIFKSISPLSSTILPRTTNKLTVVAEANDMWKIDIPTLNVVSQRPRADLKEETLELELPENNTWGDINFDLFYTPYDSNAGANVDAKIQKITYSQKGYVLDAIANTIPTGTALVPSAGGNYDITFTGDYPLNSKIRVLDNGGDILFERIAVGPYTEQPIDHVFNVPAYGKWFEERNYTVQFMRADWIDVVTNFKQKGPYYILGTNSPGNGTISGEEAVNITRKVKGDGVVKVKVVMTKEGQAPTEFETTPQNLTLEESDLVYTIPTNPGSVTRDIKAYIVTVGGEGGKEELIFSGTQRGEYYVGYILGGATSGGAYANATAYLYGNAAPDDESTVYILARANTGETRSTTYRIRDLSRNPGLVTVDIPINTTNADKVWSLYYNGNSQILLVTFTQRKP